MVRRRRGHVFGSSLCFLSSASVLNPVQTPGTLFAGLGSHIVRDMSKHILTILMAVSCCAQAQSGTQTPWHVTGTITFTHPGPSGAAVGSGQDVAEVPSGYNAVIEHISARCVAPTVLTLIYGEILVASDPANPGQSGAGGAPGQADTANNPLLFQTSYSGGGVNVYIASQQMTLRVNAPFGRVTFSGDYLNSASGAATITCLVSTSGYLIKQ